MFFKKLKYSIRRTLALADRFYDLLFIHRNRAQLRTLFAASKEWANHLVYSSPSKPNKRNVLVLAPHIDDETLGCGGAIALHVKNRDLVTVVFVTKGGNAHHDYLTKEQMVENRKIEAGEVKKIFNLHTTHFLDLEDGSLKADEQAIEGLEVILRKVNFDIVYLPHFVDTHPDHRAVNQILLACENHFSNTTVRAYESQCLMTSVLSNFVLDISSVARIKWQALKAFKSQGINFKFAVEKAKVEALSFPGSRYVEVFWEIGFSSYSELYRKLSPLVDYEKLKVSGNRRDIRSDYLNNKHVIENAYSRL